MIEINNLTTNPINEEFLKKVAKIVLEGEHPSGGRVPAKTKISLALVGSGRIRKLNKKYLGKNRVTDVLAFPQSRFLLEKSKTGQLEKIEGLGEIVLCLREVKKNTKRFGFTFEKELARILIHGILHLLGEDHEKSAKEAKKMEEKEEYYLSRTFL